MLVWKTETLSEFTGRVARSGPELAREITENVGDLLVTRIKARTPVSSGLDSFEPGVPGRLRASIHRTPVVGLGTNRLFRSIHSGRALASNYETHAETDVRYAPYVEYDTGKYGPKGRKYKIGPSPGRKAIAFRSRRTGKLVVVAYVMHPGSKGKHMFLRGAASMTDPSIERAAKPALSKWWGEFRSARPFT
jgi:hypothetical protein